MGLLKTNNTFNTIIKGVDLENANYITVKDAHANNVTGTVLGIIRQKKDEKYKKYGEYSYTLYISNDNNVLGINLSNWQGEKIYNEVIELIKGGNTIEEIFENSNLVETVEIETDYKPTYKVIIE